MDKLFHVRCTFRPHHNALAKVTVKIAGDFNKAADRKELDRELMTNHKRFWKLSGPRYQAEVLTV